MEEKQDKKVQVIVEFDRSEYDAYLFLCGLKKDEDTERVWEVLAEETGNERFIEGVQIIEEAYQPTVTKQYIRAEVKNDAGAWVAIPLGMTEA